MGRVHLVREAYEFRVVAAVVGGIAQQAVIAKLKEKYHCVIDGGYGKIKGKTFRISNMGDETDETITQLLGWLDDCLK